jgi:hypothetical protein
MQRTTHVTPSSTVNWRRSSLKDVRNNIDGITNIAFTIIDIAAAGQIRHWWRATFKNIIDYMHGITNVNRDIIVRIAGNAITIFTIIANTIPI